MKLELIEFDVEQALTLIEETLRVQAKKIGKYERALHEIATADYAANPCPSPCPGHKLHTELRMIAKAAMGEER